MVIVFGVQHSAMLAPTSRICRYYRRGSSIGTRISVSSDRESVTFYPTGGVHVFNGHVLAGDNRSRFLWLKRNPRQLSHITTPVATSQILINHYVYTSCRLALQASSVELTAVPSLRSA